MCVCVCVSVSVCVCARARARACGLVGGGAGGEGVASGTSESCTAAVSDQLVPQTTSAGQSVSADVGCLVFSTPFSMPVPKFC